MFNQELNFKIKLKSKYVLLCNQLFWFDFFIKDFVGNKIVFTK